MAERRPLIVGNWKMNGTVAGAADLLRGIVAGLDPGGPQLVACPSFVHLGAAAGAVRGTALELGAQDCHPKASGAHTGDVAAAMLAEIGCRWVILGHSERRTDHGETDTLVRAKAEAARAAGLAAIICVGETEAERNAGRALEVVRRQLAGSLPADARAAETVVAYEPVWAIGTGRTPTVAEVGEVHAALRAALSGRVDRPQAVRLLYGGSVKGANAASLLAVPEVDGALVGGASLNAAEFLAIAAAVRLGGAGPAA